MYFDPGTGSMIIQMLIAALASVGVFFVAFKSKISKFFKGIGKKHDKKDK